MAISIPVRDAAQADLLTGQLSGLGFTGFEETPDALVAYLPAAGFSRVAPGLEALAAADGLAYSVNRIPWTNWNEAWEQSFSPVLVGRFCGIRAAFHAPLQDVEHELIITPRMTFGTGHHATTASMIRLMQPLDFRGRGVFDFGSGTGILAILAAKRGAAPVLAADIDPAAVENARGNAADNGVAGQINFRVAGKAAEIAGNFDCVLANIQLDVILENLAALRAMLRPGAKLLVSGILETAYGQLAEATRDAGLTEERVLREAGWMALQYTRG